jgi:hypothetical protein
MTIKLSGSEEENDEETTNKAFTRMFETSSDTGNEDFIDEELIEAHKQLTSKWEQYCQVIEQQEKIIKKIA